MVIEHLMDGKESGSKVQRYASGLPWETHFITIGFSGVKRATDINSMYSGVFQHFKIDRFSLKYLLFH